MPHTLPILLLDIAKHRPSSHNLPSLPYQPPLLIPQSIEPLYHLINLMRHSSKRFKHSLATPSIPDFPPLTTTLSDATLGRRSGGDHCARFASHSRVFVKNPWCGRDFILCKYNIISCSLSHQFIEHYTSKWAYHIYASRHLEYRVRVKEVCSHWQSFTWTYSFLRGK